MNKAYNILQGKWNTEQTYRISDSCRNGNMFKITGKCSFINTWQKFKSMFPSSFGWMKFVSFIQCGTQNLGQEQ